MGARTGAPIIRVYAVDTGGNPSSLPPYSTFTFLLAQVPSLSLTPNAFNDIPLNVGLYTSNIVNANWAIFMATANDVDGINPGLPVNGAEQIVINRPVSGGQFTDEQLIFS